MTKYMIIDVTTPSAVRVLRVAEMPNCQLWGRIYQAEGKAVIAPPVEGRGFAKLDLLQIQYLYWSLNQKTPPDDYAVLVRECLAAIDAMPVDRTDTAWLQGEADRLQPKAPPQVSTAQDGPTTATKPPKKTKAPSTPADPTGRPKVTSTTGLVWDLADTAYRTVVPDGSADPDWKAVRAELARLCANEGINAGTMGVQYGKWKASKLGT